MRGLRNEADSFCERCVTSLRRPCDGGIQHLDPTGTRGMTSDIEQDEVFRSGERNTGFRRNDATLDAHTGHDWILARLSHLKGREKTHSECEVGCASAWRLTRLPEALTGTERSRSVFHHSDTQGALQYVSDNDRPSCVFAAQAAAAIPRTLKLKESMLLALLDELNNYPKEF